MTKGSSTPTPDEFDSVDSATARGVHRRPRSRLSKAMPFVLAIVLAPLAAYLLVNALSHGKAGVTEGNGELDPSTSASSTLPGASTSSSPAATKPAKTDKPSATPEKPDLATSVTVYNSTNTSGLAKTGATKLKAAGWTKVVATNYNGSLSRSTVFYASADLKATAQQAADDLGIGAIELSADQAKDGLAVVLESDFTP